MISRKVLDPRVRSREFFKPKLRTELGNSIDLLAYRVEQDSTSSRHNGKRNPWEPRASSKIEEAATSLKLNHTSDQQGVHHVKCDGLRRIHDTG